MTAVEIPRRSRLKPEEKRSIAASTMKTRDLAKLYDVKPDTIRVYRQPPKGSPMPVVEAADTDAIRTLIHAYEDGRWARRNWGDTAVCHYKGQAAVAWKLGHESK